jgi:sn-glycerol 3-phosphate transport system ATP-binding protein/multiple sugar transport system ATP-binding protein
LAPSEDEEGRMTKHEGALVDAPSSFVLRPSSRGIFMAEIRVNHITKRFGDFVALHELDLTVRDGEFLVLLGPSGCGKTTTLRSVAGLERQTSGDIYIGDTLVNDLPPGERDIAMVFQFYALYPHMTAFDNIAFPLRAQKTPAPEVDKRVHAVARVLQIEHLLRRRPKQLSGGEQQRVALGRAMVRRPRAFLMDEPLTNLDAALRADMRAELKHLQHELATTMVYVTHDQTEAMSMGQRIVVMNRGLLQQIGTPLEVYTRPATLFVAGFIGSPPMRLIDCALTPGDTPALADLGGALRVPIDAALAARVRASAAEQLVLGVRPEEVLIGGDGSPDFEAEVVAREPLGDETIYDLQVGGHLLQTRQPPSLRLPIGQRVPVRLDRSRLRVYDKVTERAII